MIPAGPTTIQPFVAELLSVNSHAVNASDLKTAAAIAAAIAVSKGDRVLGVYSQTEYEELVQARLKGTAYHGKA